MEASKRSLYPRHLVSEVVQPGHQVNLAPLLYLEASSRATGYGISQMAPHSGFPNSPTTLSRTSTCDLAQFKSAFFLSQNLTCKQTMKSEIVQNFRSVGPSDGAAGPSLRCDCRKLTGPPAPVTLGTLTPRRPANTEYDSPQIRNTLFFGTNQKGANKGKGSFKKI